VSSWLLDGVWNAAEVRDEHRARAIGPSIDHNEWREIHVPGHWADVNPPITTDGPLTYRRTVSTDPTPEGQRRWLTFDGIAYQADVWLDGAYLGDTEGYFAPHSFDVTDLWRLSADHVIAVEVHCPPTEDGARRAITGILQDPNGPLTPNPGGIWRSVHLSDTGPVRIDALRVLCQDATIERAHLRLNARLDSNRSCAAEIQTLVDGNVVAENRITVAAGQNDVAWRIDLPQPTLWWPRDLGGQHLVNVEVVVYVDGETSDSADRTTGLREVAWDDWICSINGERIFLKGANLMPVDVLLGRVDEEHTRRLIDDAVELGLDMLRIHGHIAPQTVYDAADELGLLLMQDFPLQGVQRRHVRQAALRQSRQMVDLLGHHPSVISWWAHDEPVAKPADGSVDQVQTLGLAGRARELATRVRRAVRDQAPTWNRSVLDPLVKRSIESADPTRRCVAHSGVLPHLPLLDGTDAHLYIGWTDGPISLLPRESARFPRLFRFVSEFGAPAAPRSPKVSDALGGAHLPDADWDTFAETTGTERWQYEQSTPPHSFLDHETWIAATERHQGDVISAWISHLRRIAYTPTGGFCVRALNDHTSGSGWGVIDLHGKRRPAFAALRSACKPVVVTIDVLPQVTPANGRLSVAVHVSSDLRHDIEGAVVDVAVWGTDSDQTHRFIGTIEADASSYIGTVTVIAPTVGQVSFIATLKTDYGTSEAMTSTEVR
jgi:beta-mannosidase